MKVTKKNCIVADKVIEILVDEKCTVEEAKDILYGVAKAVENTSTVQMGKKFSEIYYPLRKGGKDHAEK